MTRRRNRGHQLPRDYFLDLPIRHDGFGSYLWYLLSCGWSEICMELRLDIPINHTASNVLHDISSYIPVFFHLDHDIGYPIVPAVA